MIIFTVKKKKGTFLSMLSQQRGALLALTATCWTLGAEHKGRAVAHQMMKMNAVDALLAHPKNKQKHPCFCPPNNRCSALAVSPLTSAIKADEPRRCHPTPAHHDGVDYTDKRARDDNGKGARSSAATERTLITVIIS